jgi:hypothetical protein
MPAAGALVVGKKLAMQKAVAAKKALAAKKSAAKKVDKNKLLNQKRGGGGREEDDSSSIVVREKSTTLASPLLGGDDSADSSANTSKKSRSRSPLDRIHSSLKDIMKTLKKRRKLMLNKSRRMRVQADKDKKGKREGLLEKMKTTGKNMVKSAAAGAKGWWEKLQKFLLMTMLGALVIAIKENWEKIKEKIDKVVNFIKDLWKSMEPVLTPLVDGLKWVVKQWSEMGEQLLGKGKDKEKIGKETDQLSKDLDKLKSAGDEVTDKFKEAEKGVKDYEKKEFKDIVEEGGLDADVSPDDDEEPSEDGKGEGEVVEKINRSDIQTKLNDFKSNVEALESTEITVDPKKLKQYEDGAVPVSETGPAIVHKGEVIIPAPIVKQVGGPMNVVKFMEIGLGGGTEGLGALTESAKTKTISSAVGDFFSGNDGRSRRLKDDTNRASVIADLSEHLPPVMMKKMEKTLTAIKEQTEYEDSSASTVIIRVPSSAPQSGGGGGDGKTIAVPVGSSPKDTLNRYVHAVIQKALY